MNQEFYSKVQPIMALRVDSQHHLWDLQEPFDYRWLDNPAVAAIRRDYLAADLEPLLLAAGIDKTVVVQTQHNLGETTGPWRSPTTTTGSRASSAGSTWLPRIASLSSCERGGTPSLSGCDTSRKTSQMTTSS